MARTGLFAFPFIAEIPAPSFSSMLSQHISLIQHLGVVHKHFSVLRCMEIVVESFSGVTQCDIAPSLRENSPLLCKSISQLLWIAGWNKAETLRNLQHHCLKTVSDSSIWEQRPNQVKLSTLGRKWNIVEKPSPTRLVSANTTW